jgi:hypothetical protein
MTRHAVWRAFFFLQTSPVPPAWNRKPVANSFAIACRAAYYGSLEHPRNLAGRTIAMKRSILVLISLVSVVILFGFSGVAFGQTPVTLKFAEIH